MLLVCKFVDRSQHIIIRLRLWEPCDIEVRGAILRSEKNGVGRMGSEGGFSHLVRSVDQDQVRLLTFPFFT